MESTTQPILCCIGASVAGCPTQYLMERAFAAHGLDWRAISVEVAPERLAVAMDGMAAMNFRALRIYPSLDQIAVQALGEFNPLIRFVGRASSASLTEAGWQAWDHYGFGALKVARGAFDLSRSLCWLHGDTPHNRSVLAALQAELQSDQAMPASIIWTGRPDILPESLNDLQIASLDLDAISEISSPDARQEDQQPSDSASPLSPILGDLPDLLLFAEDSGGLSDLECKLLAKHVKKLHLFTSSPTTSRLADLPLSVVSDVEIAIAAEAYDFQRWTNQPADCGLFRDAYDEFGAF